MCRHTAGVSEPESSLTLAQLALMDLVWDHGEITAAQARRLLSAKRPVARTTVLTLLSRLEERGWLRHRAEGRTFWYCAARDRASSVGGLLRALRDTAFDGSTEGLVAALVSQRDVSAEEIRRIRRLLAKIEAERKESS
jgi:predicted transcriptional regulator